MTIENCSCCLPSCSQMDSKGTVECHEKCVFCQTDGDWSSARQLKILRCLHVSCKSCAEQFLSYENTIECARCQIVTPDPGPGRKLSEYLVSWPSRQLAAVTASQEHNDQSIEASSNEAMVCQNSDCEGVDEPATVRCLTCNRLLCEQHSAIHKRSMKSRDHSVADVSLESERVLADDERCVLHNEELQTYCISCKVLLCDRCNADKQHAERCEEEPIAVHVAAERLRKAQIQRRQAKRFVLEVSANFLKTIQANVDTANERAKELSEEISTDIAAGVKVLQEQGEHMQRSLDQARLKTVNHLEKIKDDTDEERRKLDTAVYLSKLLGDAAVLRALAIRSDGEFLDDSTDGLEYCNFMDMNLDDYDSEDDSDYEPEVNGDETSEEDADDESDDDDDEDTSEDEDKPRLPGCELDFFEFTPTIARSMKLLQWAAEQKAKPKKSDRQVCSIKLFHMFSPSLKSKDITLSEDMRQATCTIRATSETGWSSVCTTPPPGPFIVEIVSGDVFLGFASSTAHVGNGTDWPQEPGRFHGWAPRGSERSLATGGVLSTPWTAGHFVHLQLDKVGRKATAWRSRCVFSGSKETISINEDQFPLCFRAELGPNASIRLLPIYLIT
eukprot:scpid56518/ scgid2922/ 